MGSLRGLCLFLINSSVLSSQHMWLSWGTRTGRTPPCNDGTSYCWPGSHCSRRMGHRAQERGHLRDLLLQLPISTPSSFTSLRTQDPVPRLLLFWPFCSMCAHPDVFWSNHTPLHALLSPQSSLGLSFPICSPCTVFQGWWRSLHTECLLVSVVPRAQHRGNNGWKWLTFPPLVFAWVWDVCLFPCRGQDLASQLSVAVTSHCPSGQWTGCTEEKPGSDTIDSLCFTSFLLDQSSCVLTSCQTHFCIPSATQVTPHLHEQITSQGLRKAMLAGWGVEQQKPSLWTKLWRTGRKKGWFSFTVCWSRPNSAYLHPCRFVGSMKFGTALCFGEAQDINVLG